jgi:hypothetical protein
MFSKKAKIKKLHNQTPLLFVAAQFGFNEAWAVVVFFSRWKWSNVAPEGFNEAWAIASHGPYATNWTVDESEPPCRASHAGTIQFLGA